MQSNCVINKILACNGSTRVSARTGDLYDGVPSRNPRDTTRIAATMMECYDVYPGRPDVFPQPVEVAQFAHGVAPQPTNPHDRTTYVKFLVEVQCLERHGFCVRYLDESIAVDLDAELKQLACAIYHAAMRKWPDLRTTHVSAHRNRQAVDEPDLHRTVQEVLPLAWNDETLYVRLHAPRPPAGGVAWTEVSNA